MTRNLLGLGILSHITALILAMIPRFELLGVFLYVFAFIFLIAGITAQWKAPHKEVRFYITILLALLPLAGPIVSLKLASSQLKNKDTGRFLPRVHPVALLIWGLILAAAITVTSIGEDPYFDAIRNTDHAIGR